MKIRPNGRENFSTLVSTTLTVLVFLATTTTVRAAVGYVNVPLTNGYALLVNPLNAPPNSITNVIPNPPDGTRVWLWNVTAQSFDAPAVFNDEVPGWNNNLELPPGRGFVIRTLQNYTHTFIGTVLQGLQTNFIAGSNRLTLVGSRVPQAGPLAHPLQFPGSNGDVVSLFLTPGQQFLDGYTYLPDFGWFDPVGAAGPDGPVIPVAASLFVRHRGPDTNWVRNFAINLGVGLTVSGSSSSPPPDIVGFTIQNNQATLRISDPNRSFNVQFSTDRVFWTTIATNQIGGSWTGPCPAPTVGFFQLVSP